MTFKLSTRWIAFGAFVILVGIILAVNRIEDWATTISYPLDTWRMDLDDFFVAIMSVGILLSGLGGFGLLWRKADRAHAHADKAIDSINGGMTSIATQVIHDELRVADLEIGLSKRVAALEQAIEDCAEREITWAQEKAQLRRDRTALRDWLNRRLDETGNGRSEVRDGE